MIGGGSFGSSVDACLPRPPRTTGYKPLTGAVAAKAQMAAWSRGMIPALGAGGPGFESPCGPLWKHNIPT